MLSSFESLGVLPLFCTILAGRHITKPADIQEQVIPRLLANRTTLFCAPTGTGKTLAYLLPMLGRILEGAGERRQSPRVVVCAPTYELAAQIKGEADSLLADTGLRAALLIGQTGLNRQIEGLKKDAPVLVVGNPGRLLLLAKMGKLNLRNVDFLVLDEGDRLVADELAGETRELVDLIHRKRNPDSPEPFLAAACSATFSNRSRERLLPLLGEGAEVVERSGDILREKVLHWALYSEERRKPDTLRAFVAAADPAGKKKSFKALVFTAKAAEVGNISAYLQRRGLGVTGLLGDMTNQARRQALDDFRAGRVKLLVTSDLAARGLDIPDISHVVALDVGDGDSYIHRAGRTARAGRRGIMLTIGNEAEMRRLAALEKKLGITVYPKELYAGKIISPEQNTDAAQ